jgi:hypothetical protein
MEMWLGQTGYYDLDRREGPTGYGSPTVDDAILSFQKDHALTADGWAGPGGETEKALQRTAEAPSVPEAKATSIGFSLLGDDNPFQMQRGRRVGEHAGRLGPLVAPLLNLLRPDKPPSDSAPQANAPSPRGSDQPVDPNLPVQRPTDGSTAPRLRSEDFGVQPQSAGEAVLFDEILLMANPDGRRGGKEADRSNQILVQECERILDEEYPHLRGKILHIAGGKEGGRNDGRPVAEKLIRSVDDPDGKTSSGGSLADIMYGKSREGDVYAGANTMTTKADGTPTANEWRRFQNLVRNAAGRFMGQVPKLGPNVDEDEVRRASVKTCRGILDSLEEQLAEKGELDGPDDGKEE